ncbi:hypothetical protein LNV09_01560 [Paucibacter sp. B2R-40]|uniref:hypothetical protein n=1 Tax=Paucibacter sp. B2R-40 TaxID=2893554 RepID=UPI0021E41572|nr:hypothetical protein [Paucibacter sp. B2R-40]MCV2352842.1 hypothetical protein [Paucibacter sp. B2R-40]
MQTNSDKGMNSMAAWGLSILLSLGAAGCAAPAQTSTGKQPYEAPETLTGSMLKRAPARPNTPHTPEEAAELEALRKEISQQGSAHIDKGGAPR